MFSSHSKLLHILAIAARYFEWINSLKASISLISFVKKIIEDRLYVITLQIMLILLLLAHFNKDYTICAIAHQSY